MELTRMSVTGRQRVTLTAFSGLNRQTSAQPGEWTQMLGIDTQACPQMAPHRALERVRSYEGVLQGAASTGSGIAVVCAGSLYIDGVEVLTGLSEGKKSIVEFWGKVVVFPDAKYYDCANDAAGAIGAGVTYPDAGSCPHIDYAVVQDNRIFGVGEGTLYACKPGDLTDWTTFVDADGNPAENGAYALQLVGVGELTGITSYSGHIIAFRQDQMKMLYGQRPSNYQTVDAAAVGCMEGVSIAVAAEALFYLSRGGLMRYGGSLPGCVSLPVGTDLTQAACAGDTGCLYMASGGLLYVYDTYRQAWSVMAECREGARPIVHMGELYLLDGDGVLYRRGREKCTYFEGVLRETAPAAGKKVLMQRLDVRCRIAEGAWLRIECSPDGKEWISCLDTRDDLPVPSWTASTGVSLRRVMLPKCDAYRLRISGGGDVVLYELAETVRLGGDSG